MGASSRRSTAVGHRATDATRCELAREKGRVVAYANVESGEVGDQVISFDATAARSAYASTLIADAVIRDAAVSPDGRVALSLHDGRRWTITAFALGAAGALQRDRTIAKPRDGFRAGTLAFSADGARIVWRNRSGTARSAVLRQ